MGRLIGTLLTLVGACTICDMIKEKADKYISNKIDEGIKAREKEIFDRGYQKGYENGTYSVK